jgi:hypothetical protein
MLSKLNRSAARDHTEDHRLCKPRQVREHPKVEASINEYFDRSGRKELDFALATKADGQNGYLRLTERPVQLWKRQGTRPAMEIPRFERFLTREALDGLRAELGVEITAWLVRPGRPDVELGHAWVDRAMKAFVQNGYENKGKLHMRLRIFRLVGNYAPASCLRDLKELVVPCNGVLDVVPLERCLVRRAGGRALQYFMWLPGNVRQFAGHDMEQFIQFALRQAAPLGIEGYVACFPEDALRRPDEGVPFKHDSLGTPRARCLLKVKLEPTGRVVAVKVDNAEASEVWLFAKPEDPKMHAAQLLRYAGNASDNPILQGFLEGKLAPLTYETPEEKRVLYQPKRLMDLAPGAVIVHVTSAAITPRDLLTGIKIYGTRRAETNDRHRITPDDYLDALDPIEPIARALPHLVSVRAGIEALKREEGFLELGEEDAVEDPLPRPDLKRKQREYSPKWVTHERFPSHEREHLPEPEEEEEDDEDESKQYSPVREHSPEPEEEEDDEPRQYSPLRQHSPEPQDDDDCPASLPY